MPRGGERWGEGGESRPTVVRCYVLRCWVLCAGATCQVPGAGATCDMPQKTISIRLRSPEIGLADARREREICFGA